MCNPISLILTEDKVFLPPEDYWDHSHSFIMEKNNIPDGLIGDKYLRLEVYPPEENIFRDKDTNERLEVDDTWKVFVDEKNVPDWYSIDKPNQEYRARTAANKWLQNFPDNLAPGYKEIAGNFAKIIAGSFATLNAENYSVLTSGDHSVLFGKNCSELIAGEVSTLTAGEHSELKSKNHSELTAGNNSELIAGIFSKLTSGNNSTLIAGGCSSLAAGSNSKLTAGNNSTFCAGENSSFILYWNDGNRRRVTVAYVGEDGIKPNTKYLGEYGKFTEVKG